MSDVRFPRPSVRSEFRRRLRADLMREAVALAEERRARRAWPLALFAFRLRPIAVTAAVALVLLGGSGYAAAGSLPGDPAYGLKRAAEEVELALAAGDEARVRVLAAQSERRLEELQRSAARPDRSPTASAEYQAAVQRFSAAVSAVRSAPAGEKRDAVEKVVEAARDKHVQVLETLRERLPGTAQEKVDKAIEQHKQNDEKRDDRPRTSPPAKGTPRKP